MILKQPTSTNKNAQQHESLGECIIKTQRRYIIPINMDTIKNRKQVSVGVDAERLKPRWPLGGHVKKEVQRKWYEELSEN